MRALLALSVLIAGCTSSSLPTPDPQQAWVELDALPGHHLSAQRLDDQRVSDGRYFQLTPGAHELRMRYQYESQLGTDAFGEPRYVTCELRMRYDAFAAGQRYRLHARPLALKAQARLYDGHNQVLARGEVLRCGPI